MGDPDFIPRKPVLEPAEDFAFLRREGLRWIERLAHELWTDYNLHDPGVTLLELLSYAITDLGYRTGYPLRDLLTEEVQGRAVNRSQFHTAREILTCNPVSFDDLRKLLIDLPGVRNAWIEKHGSVRYWLDAAKACLADVPPPGREAVQNPPLNGLYDVFIEYEEVVDEPPPLALGARDKAPAGGGYAEAGKAAVRFGVERPLTLVSVSVYPESAGLVRVRLLDKDRRVLARTELHVRTAGEKTVVPLGFALAAGEDYALDAAGSAVRLHRDTEPPPAGVSLLAQRIGLAPKTYAAGRESYPAFYDWQVADADPSVPTRQTVRRAVKERLSRYRNLCEDFVNVCDLEKEEIAVCADIELVPSADVEAVLAEIFYRVGQHVSPPVRFYGIEELRARGRGMDTIFEGPRLEHGFIDDEEFQRIKRCCEIRSSDVVQLLMDIPGVVAVRRIALLSFIDGVLRTQQPWVLPLATDRFRVPAFTGEKSKIIFYKNDLPYYANRERVAELVAEKKGADAYRKLKGHQRDLPIPVGEPKALADYVPAQHELPAVYAAGRQRVAESDTPLRQAQARQLKAYLLFFEQMLANYLAQLANVRQLLSWEEGADRTYFSQPVTDIAGAEDLYDASLLTGAGALDAGALQQALDAMAETPAQAEARRLRFLEHLSARFCESFADYSLLMFNQSGEAARARLIADQRAFLADYPMLSRGRGTAYDYRFPREADNLSGYQRRVYRLLGIHEVTRRDLACHGLDVVEAAPGAWRFVLRDEEDVDLFRSIVCESASAIEALLDFALGIGGDPANYRATAAGHELVRRCSDQAKDEAIGATTSADALDAVLAYFRCYGEAEGFHTVEHILLRKRTAGDPFLPVQLNAAGECGCPEVREPYSFRMSVLLPSWPTRFQDMKFRAFVEETLRREAPAHVLARICWISHVQMRRFETAYSAWSEQLAGLDPRLGCCHAAGQRGGELPLPKSEAADAAYGASLQRLIEVMHGLVSVYPLARLHDCEHADGDQPRISLNNTSLGTF